MKNSFTINEKTRIIYENLSENITTDEYIKLKHDEFHHKKFNRHYNLITDFRKCENNFSKEDFQSMIDIFKENKGKLNRKKSALIISDYNCLKGINLEPDTNPENPHEIQYFKDAEEAEKWILS